MKSDFRFHHKLRVRFAETDLQGIVFNGNYMTYYDVAQAEYFRAIGLTFQELVASGTDTVLARMTLDFKAPAHFDDILEIHARVSKIGNTSFTLEFEIYIEGDDRIIGAATALYVCVDPKSLRPTRVPDDLRERMGRLEEKDFL